MLLLLWTSGGPFRNFPSSGLCLSERRISTRQSDRASSTEPFLKRALSPFLTGRMFVRPNILRTLRRTMIRFLTELSVRRTWFGQFDELYFVLNRLVMRSKLRARTCGRQHDRKCRLNSSIYFNHPSQGNSTNYCLILGPRDKAAPPTSQQSNIYKKIPPKRVKNLATPSTIFIFISSSSTGELCSQPIRGNDRPIGRMFPEHVERSFLDSNIASTNTSN